MRHFWFASKAPERFQQIITQFQHVMIYITARQKTSTKVFKNPQGFSFREKEKGRDRERKRNV